MNFLIGLFLFSSIQASALSLKAVFGAGQPEYHQTVYMKVWKWLQDKNQILLKTPDEKKIAELVEACVKQVQGFSENLDKDVDLNYLRVRFSQNFTQVQLYCPDSVLGERKKDFLAWFKRKSWTGNFWVWTIGKNQIDNYTLIREAPKDLDLSILARVRDGFSSASFYFKSALPNRLIFLKPQEGTQKYQVHPFADPDRYILYDESGESVEYSTKILIVENHPEPIKKLNNQFIEEFGIIPDRMFSTKSGLGLNLP